MKKIIIANWKMNPNSLKEAKDIFEGIKSGVPAFAKGSSEAMEVVVCPPFLYLKDLWDVRHPTGMSDILVSLGAQNLFYEEKGAYTGEISASMLKDLGCEYVIIGHSERRKYFDETDETVNKKIKSAIKAGLKPIFCVGETEEQRNSGKAEEVVERQIKIGLAGIENWKLKIENLIVAYEPVWAIGTGNACGVEDAKKMREFIEKKIKNTSIVYGGSVNSQNASDYVKKAGYNGFLVGGASLKPDEFIKIINLI